MRKTFGLLALPVLSVALILCCSLVNFAQNREKFVISAKAGGINAITGGASVHGKGETDWQQLSITDDLNSGDRVRTSSDGRVEILLNPGSYLRVGGNSEVELSDNTLSNLEVRLLRGTAIVEATGVDGLDLNISISTPHTKLAIVRQGLYRLNVVPEDATELIVRKGRVILSDSHTKVKGGNKVVFSATTVSVAKLTKEEKKAAEKSDVDTWSKERADTLAKANSRITGRMLTTAFSSFGGYDVFNRGFGLWFYNSRFGCYTFLPFFYGFGSPYGSSYATSIYGYGGYYYYPRPNGNPGYWPNGNAGGNTASGGQSGSSGGSSGGGGGSYHPTTPTAIPSTTPSGGMSQPRMIDPDTGSRMPRKNIELPQRPNN
jgi:uncharacterized membrane protein YgcG